MSNDSVSDSGDRNVGARIRERLRILMDQRAVDPYTFPEAHLQRRFNIEMTQERLEAAMAVGDEFMIRQWARVLADESLMNVTPTIDRGSLPAIQIRIERAIAASPLYGPSRVPIVLIDRFHTPTLNAECEQFPEGYAILLHSGTDVLLHNLCSILWSAESGAQEIHDEGYQHLAPLLKALARGEDILDYPMHLNKDIKFVWSGVYERAIKEFIIAHEYGHILAGHFDRIDSSTPIAPDDLGTASLTRAWDREYEADEIGLRLTLGETFPSPEQDELLASVQSQLEHDSLRGDDAGRWLEVNAAVAAPAIFFCLSAIHDSLAQRLIHPPVNSFYSTHPSPYDRLDGTRQEYCRHNLTSLT